MSSQISINIQRFEKLKTRAATVGITLLSNCWSDYIGFKDIPHSKGDIFFENLNDAEQFILGYEYGYKSGNKQ